MSAQRKAWWGQAVAALMAALVVNVALSSLDVEHDPVLITLLALAVVTAGALALQAIDALSRPTWRARRPDSRPGPGEDTRTAMFRHLVEVHETSRVADDAVLWQLADLAAKRMRQVHGLRYADDPVRATELLGPQLAEWVARDRRDRYRPDERHRRYSTAQLEDVVRRIEAL